VLWLTYGVLYVDIKYSSMPISLFCLMYLYVTKIRYFKERNTQKTTRGEVRRTDETAPCLNSNSLSSHSLSK